jgi:serine phosphatase RsbU (regulator of sigma subunit)
MQTRGMMRLALRLGQPLSVLAHQLNQQLLEDLPSGRFVTAWFAMLDARAHTLHSFSAGQGPLFVYRRATDAFEPVDTDAPPMGIMDFDAAMCATQTVSLGPGDLFVAVTDGYYEAPEAGGGAGQFGEDRVFEIVRRLRDEPLERIVAELDAAVLAYHGAAFTPDDRTAILVRRAVG